MPWRQFVGIDPGVGGGIAVLHENGTVLSVRKMPATERDLYETLSAIASDVMPAFAALEFVRAMPKMGVASMFQFGRGYGALRMGLVACGIPFDEVTPLKWQRAMGCLTKGDKNVSKARAQELFPGVQRVTHHIADALLLAEYSRRTRV